MDRGIEHTERRLDAARKRTERDHSESALIERVRAEEAYTKAWQIELDRVSSEVGLDQGRMADNREADMRAAHDGYNPNR